MNAHTQELRFNIAGMHCVACAGLVETKLRSLPQIVSAEVDDRTKQALINYVGDLDVLALQRTLAKDGYELTVARQEMPGANGRSDYVEIGAVLLLLAGLAVLLHHFDLLPRGLQVSETISYGLVFLIGLVASVSSCLAVTGGLLVAVAAKYNQANTHSTGWSRAKPLIAFNAGRLVSYGLLGGLVGLLGSAFTLSPAASGFVTIVASIIMIALGLQMLHLLPAIGRLFPSMSRLFSFRMNALAARKTQGAAFALGASTFFLPCGYTQALQLYVLTQGSFVSGALIMLVFALGTLPALVSLSAISSFAKGSSQKHFVRVAGAAVIILGFLNIQYGLVLTGSGMRSTRVEAATEVRNTTPVNLPPQQMAMKIVGLDYQPNTFAVKLGQSVEWRIDASQAVGCGRVILVPGLGIKKLLSAKEPTMIAFTPTKSGEFAFNCGMGMMTPDSKITVLPKAKA